MRSNTNPDVTAIVQQETSSLNPVLDAIMKSIPVQSDGEIIACPGCSSVMEKRQAVIEHSLGKYFWACSEFPKCREVVKIVEG